MPSVPQGPGPCKPEESYEEHLIRVTAAPFAIVPSAALLDKRLSAVEYRVLSVLCWHTNKRHFVWTSQETVARELGMGQSYVSQCISRLRELGYVDVVRRAYRGTEARRTNVYRVVWQRNDPEAVEEAMREADAESRRTDDHISTDRIYDAPYIRSVDNHISTDRIQNSTIEQYHVRDTVKRNVSPYPKSSVKQPPLAAAPRGGAGQDLSGTTGTADALGRDPLYLAAVAALGYAPLTPRERETWAVMINRFRRLRLTPEALTAAIIEHARRWPDRTITLRSIEAHWSILTGGERHGTGLAISGTARAETDRSRREQEQRERERREWQHNEAMRILTEPDYYGSADPYGPGLAADRR